MTETARFALPLLHAGQSQKEMFHNEALTQIDSLLHPAVVAIGIETPPADPVPGAAWVVGPAPSGAWADHPGAVATWTDGGWRFAVPRPGLCVWVESLGVTARYHAGAWQTGVIAAARIDIGGVQVLGDRGAAIPAPTGGTVTDSEARSAIVAILDAMRAHGLIAATEL
ncbi:DUF2793 domain-containing protein [Sphingomonas sp.]|uniref:DUF2793 domain-containing protein n=1 Tax=Sphingomonas sp. TaxID=28214 RepID=UPI00307F63BD